MPAIQKEGRALETLSELFRSWCGDLGRSYEEEDLVITALPASGSGRKYYRLSAGELSAIGVWNPNLPENRAFIGMAGHFRQAGLPVPEVYAQSEDHSCYLQTDLGDQRLFDLLPVGEGGMRPLSPELEALYRQSLDLLIRLQFEGSKGLDYGLCWPVEVFDRQAVLFDLYYFKYYFLKLFKLPFEEPALERDFQHLAERFTRDEPRYFQHRDFQSRNLMLKDGQLYLIDFQGGRRGEVAYDVVSLLWQARARIPMEQREALFAYYLEGVERLAPNALPGGDAAKERWHERYLNMALLRTLQVLGAYGLRGRIEGKAHFFKSIAPALGNLRYLLGELPFWAEFPALQAALQRAVEEVPARLELLSPPQPAEAVEDASLEVYISSFSYKRGLPEGPGNNEHGGGFIFDCRFLDNPGRLEAYRQLSGKDKAVQQFLLQREETQRFLRRVKTMIDEAVDKYLSRNFTSLQVHFGCTGGQHRSVFMAEMLAEHLRERGVGVVLRHREEGLWY